MKGADTNLYRELEDWRKVVLVLGVEQTLVKPQAGEDTVLLEREVTVVCQR